MLIRYCGPGLLGLGITALVAGFMSGMAGNVSAFSTVWTYDIYGAYMNKKRQRQALRADGPLVDGDRHAGLDRHGVPGDERGVASWTTCRRCSASSSRRCSAR